MSIITRFLQGKKSQQSQSILGRPVHLRAFHRRSSQTKPQKGLELTSEQIDSLKQADTFEYTYAKLLNFLSYRPRTVKEVRDRLYKYKVKDKVKQDLLIERLQSKGYLDDLKFTQWFIESRNAHRPRSPRMPTAELKTKGVSEEVIKSVINEVTDETETIRHLLTKTRRSTHS